MSRLRNVAQVWGWLGQFPVVAAAEHSTVKLYPHEALLGWVPPMLSGTVYFKFVLHHLLPYLSKRSTAKLLTTAATTIVGAWCTRPRPAPYCWIETQRHARCLT